MRRCGGMRGIMNRKIWRDYWKIWRFRQMKASWKERNFFTELWSMVYLLFVLPCFWLKAMQTAGPIYYSYLIPALWGLFTARRIPFGLFKIAYLVPMSAADRKHYLIGMYWLKVAVPLAFSLIAMLSVTFFSLMDWYEFFFGIFMQLLLSMVMQLTADRLPAEQKKGTLTHVGAWSVVAICFGFIFLATAPLWIVIGKVKPADYRWGFAGILCCQALLTLKCMRNYGALLENNMFYESRTKRLTQRGRND